MTDITPGGDTDPEVSEGIFSKRFWKRATERAVKTVAQFELAALGLSDATSAEKWAFDLKTVAIAAAAGAALSYGTSIITAPFGKTPVDNPSLVK